MMYYFQKFNANPIVNNAGPNGPTAGGLENHESVWSLLNTHESNNKTKPHSMYSQSIKLLS